MHISNAQHVILPACHVPTQRPALPASPALSWRSTPATYAAAYQQCSSIQLLINVKHATINAPPVYLHHPPSALLAPLTANAPLLTQPVHVIFTTSMMAVHPLALIVIIAVILALALLPPTVLLAIKLHIAFCPIANVYVWPITMIMEYFNSVNLVLIIVSLV